MTGAGGAADSQRTLKPNLNSVKNECTSASNLDHADTAKFGGINVPPCRCSMAVSLQ